jgi:hypothetical protein
MGAGSYPKVMPTAHFQDEKKVTEWMKDEIS